MIYIGIDNGLDGGIVAIKQDRSVLFAVVTPTLKDGTTGKRHYNLGLMKELLKSYPDPHVTLEKAQSMPGQGVASTFSTGRGYGLWEGLFVGLGIRYSVVHPRTWQSAICRDIPGDTKTRSVLACQRELPGLDLYPGKKRKPHDGLADAACMALYGLTKWGGDR